MFTSTLTDDHQATLPSLVKTDLIVKSEKTLDKHKIHIDCDLNGLPVIVRYFPKKKYFNPLALTNVLNQLEQIYPLLSDKNEAQEALTAISEAIELSKSLTAFANRCSEFEAIILCEFKREGAYAIHLSMSPLNTEYKIITAGSIKIGLYKVNENSYLTNSNAIITENACHLRIIKPTSEDNPNFEEYTHVVKIPSKQQQLITQLSFIGILPPKTMPIIAKNILRQPLPEKKHAETEYYFACGEIYRSGYGVDKNPSNAELYYKIAAENGHIQSLIQLSLLVQRKASDEYNIHLIKYLEKLEETARPNLQNPDYLITFLTYVLLVKCEYLKRLGKYAEAKKCCNDAIAKINGCNTREDARLKTQITHFEKIAGNCDAIYAEEEKTFKLQTHFHSNSKSLAQLDDLKSDPLFQYYAHLSKTNKSLLINTQSQHAQEVLSDKTKSMTIDLTKALYLFYILSDRTRLNNADKKQIEEAITLFENVADKGCRVAHRELGFAYFYLDDFEKSKISFIEGIYAGYPMQAKFLCDRIYANEIDDALSEGKIHDAVNIMKKGLTALEIALKFMKQKREDWSDEDKNNIERDIEILKTKIQTNQLKPSYIYSNKYIKPLPQLTLTNEQQTLLKNISEKIVAQKEKDNAPLDERIKILCEIIECLTQPIHVIQENMYKEKLRTFQCAAQYVLHNLEKCLYQEKLTDNLNKIRANSAKERWKKISAFFYGNFAYRAPKEAYALERLDPKHRAWNSAIEGRIAFKN